MSQTTFLESVVSWDQEKCQHNLDEALPKLIDCLKSADIIKEQVGILKIICQLFLPCLQIEQTENRLFRHIVSQTCCIFDSILEDLKNLEKNQDVTFLSGKVISFLGLLSDIVECCEVCLKYVGTTDRPVSWSEVQSLPKGTVHILKGTYGHCRGSTELYGDLLVHVSDPLSALFRKAHSLQVVFLGLLDKLTVDSNISDQGIHSICTVCYGLFEVCQIVTSLDIKLVVTLWKAISRHAVQKKEFLKNHINMDKMIRYLCTEITTGYSYLFQLAPQVNEDGIALSQGDEKGFQKSLKILGFQMKVMVSLVKEYSDFLCECGSDVYMLLIHLQRLMPPSLHRPSIDTQHCDEIQRQLLNATEPLISYLLGNVMFMENLTSHMSFQKMKDEDCLPHLLLTKLVIDALPKLQDSDYSKWLAPVNNTENKPRHSVLEAVFLSVNKCSVEISLPVYLPGQLTSNRKEREICLYDDICVHYCGFIGSLSASHFSKLEGVLLENVLSTSPVCSQLAADVWCFLVRYGTADLCDCHVKLLLSVMKDIQGQTVQYRNLMVLVNRMIKFLAKEHQTDIINLYPPASNFSVWSGLSISGFTSNNARNLVDTLVTQSVKVIHNFINTTEKTASTFTNLIAALDVLLNIFNNANTSEKYIRPEVLSTMVTKTTSLYNSISDWTVLPVTRLCFAKILQFSGCLAQNLNSKEILNILLSIIAVLKTTTDQYLKLSVVKFLYQLGKVKFPPSVEQSQILNRIPDIFHTLLLDTDIIVQHVTLDKFTSFAETTVHESIVPQCIQNQTDLQDKVVAFLNKTPVSSSMKRAEYLKIMIDGSKDIPVTYGGTEDEPASKRQRTDVSESKNKRLIDLMVDCSQRLQRNPDRLPQDLVHKLQETQTLISKILDENG